jgi:hypothetical protein
LKGLGDLIALLAKPFARLLDRLFRTKVQGCKPCAMRQEKLNRLLPFS